VILDLYAAKTTIWFGPTPFSIMRQLDKKELPDKQPKAVFRLLSKVFSDKNQWISDSFRNVLNRIIQAEPKIKDEPAYRVMDDYLVQYVR